MYKRLSTISILCMFCLGTVYTHASLIGGYIRVGPVGLYNAESTKRISTKNVGCNVNFSWQTNRTEEFDLDFVVSSSSIGLSGAYPMPSITWKRLIPLSYNTTVYCGAGPSFIMPKYQWKQRTIALGLTAGFIYYYTPKLCIEVFTKRHFIFDDNRLNQSGRLANINKVKGDVPLVSIRFGVYAF